MYYDEASGDIGYQVTDYTLLEPSIVHLTSGGNNLHFFYDEQNKPAMVAYNGLLYSYAYNLQGDVIAMLNANGTVVVEYRYDAWGKPISKTGTLATTLSTLNPFRYRGYVYDEETGLYYLRSRYYNPSICRFVNADTQISYGGVNCNANVFAYCFNAPIRYSDFSGQSALDAAKPVLAEMTMWDGPLPFLDGLAFATIVILGIYDMATVYSQAWSVTHSTSTKVLPDTKVNLSKPNYSYQLAYVSESGGLIRTGPKMNLGAAIAALGVTGEINIAANAYMYDRSRSSYAQRQLEHLGSGNWGIYANSQGAAKALAVIFQGNEQPEVHGSGMYGHYHDVTHTFHIWYGGTLTY